MAVFPQQEALDTGLDFLEHSYLTYTIPFATNFNPEQDLKQTQSSRGSPIDSIEKRESLFFGKSSLSWCNTFVLHCSFVDHR